MLFSTNLYDLKGDDEIELAAMAFFGCDPDAAAVQLHDLLGDGHAQPRAAALLQLARADLHEVLEEFPLVLDRYAGALVLHSQQNRHLVTTHTYSRRMGDNRATLVTISH